MLLTLLHLHPRHHATPFMRCFCYPWDGHRYKPTEADCQRCSGFSVLCGEHPPVIFIQDAKIFTLPASSPYLPCGVFSHYAFLWHYRLCSSYGPNSTSAWTTAWPCCKLSLNLFLFYCLGLRWRQFQRLLVGLPHPDSSNPVVKKPIEGVLIDANYAHFYYTQKKGSNSWVCGPTLISGLGQNHIYYLAPYFPV